MPPQRKPYTDAAGRIFLCIPLAGKGNRSGETESHRRTWQTGTPVLPWPGSRNYPKQGTLDILAWHSGDAHISPAYLLRQQGHAQVEAKWAVYYDLTAARDKAAALAPDWVWKSGNVPDLTEMYAPRILMRKELAEPK